MERMNKIRLQQQRNDTMRLLDTQKKKHIGCVAIAVGKRKGITLEHELAKFFLAYEAATLGKEFVTEAYFVNGKRADVLITDDGEAWEVLKSEKFENIMKKRENYPVHVIPFRAMKIIDHWVKKLGYVRRDDGSERTSYS